MTAIPKTVTSVTVGVQIPNMFLIQLVNSSSVVKYNGDPNDGYSKNGTVRYAGCTLLHWDKTTKQAEWVNE